MLDNNYGPAFVRSVEEVFHAGDSDPVPGRQGAGSFEWRRVLPPDVAGKESRLVQAQAEYPLPHRMLPTRLGNILRATEDEISQGQGTQDLLLRRGDDIPARLRLHHDQFRTRLDMYCTLIFVHLGLAALTVALLAPAGNSLLGTAVIAAVFLVLAVASYSAAIASARGYCTTLKVIFSAPGAG